jgi:hypothetical protein
MATHPKFARLAHYSCECVEASHIFLKNGVWQVSGESGESGESEQNRLANVSESGKSVQLGFANVCESGEYLPSLLMNVGSSKIGCFMLK